MAKPITPEEIEEFRQRWLHNNAMDVAKVYNVKPSTIRNWGSEFEISKKRPKIVPMIAEGNAETSYEELIENLKKQSSIVKKIINYNSIVSAKIETETPIALTFWSDFHLGSEGCDYESFDNDLKFIEETEGLFTFVGGDSIDGMILTDMNAGLNQTPIMIQKRLIREVLKRVKNKIIALGTGNHNFWTQNVAGFDDLADLAKELNILYTGLGGMLKLTVGNITYDIFRTHKYPGSLNANNLTLSVKNLWKNGTHDHDVGVIEHGHQSAIEEWTAHNKKRVAVRTGTYKILDLYALGKGFYGSQVKNPTIIFYPNIKKMVAFNDMYDSITYLRGEEFAS